MIDDKITYLCDIGGPLIRKRDGALLGTASMVLYTDSTKNIPSHQIFTFVPFHFDWISAVTGLILPQCSDI